MRVLDLGCGSGKDLASWGVTESAEVVGLDIDYRLLGAMVRTSAHPPSTNEAILDLVPRDVDALQHGPAVLIGYGPVVVRVSAVVGE